MNIIKKIKDKWNAYLKKMAKSNNETFGDERLDCCKMNQKSNK